MDTFKKHPIAFIGLIIGIIIFLFFPILFVIFLIIGLVYESLPREELKHKPLSPLTPLGHKELDPRKWNYHQKQEYLASPEWKRLAGLVKLKALYKCENCGSKTSLQTHHITYERLGKENINDLVCLCAVCHSKIHEKLGYSQFSTYPISALKD